MSKFAIEFKITPHSYFSNEEMNSSVLYILLEIKNLTFRQKTLLQSSSYKNVFSNDASIYLYDLNLIKVEKFETNINLYFNQYVLLRPKIHQKNIISLQDSILYLHPKKYIQIEQELDATNENILDTSISIRIESILKLLQIIS